MPSTSGVGSATMGEAITDPLIRDLLAWLASGPRPYDEVMDAWRPSCPRLTVWEDAVDAGLVQRVHDGATRRLVVRLTVRGRDLLKPELAPR